MNNIFKKHGYVFVANPDSNIKPLHLLFKGIGSTAEQMNAGLGDLFLNEEQAIPYIHKNVTMASEIFGNQQLELNIGTQFQLLKNLFTIAGQGGVNLRYGNSHIANFSFQNPKKSYVSLLDLDKYIETAGLKPHSQFTKSKLYNGFIYVITEIITTKKFSLTILKESAMSGEASAGKEGLQAELQVNKNSNIVDSIEHDSPVPIVVAIKACQIFYKKPFFKKGILAIKEGRIEVMKSGDLPVVFLDSETI